MSHRRSPVEQELRRRNFLRHGRGYGPMFIPASIASQQSYTPQQPNTISPAASNFSPINTLISPAAKNFVPVTPDYGIPLRRRKALLVGIGYSQHKQLTTLPGSRNDVIEMFRLLTSSWFGFPEASVKVLCDDLVSIGHVKSQMPTRQNIVDSLSWLTRDIVAGDSVVFFFSGHGQTVVDISGDEVDTGYDQSIVPVDYQHVPLHRSSKFKLRGTTPILDDIIYERLVRGIPYGAKATAIVDACASGSICDLPVSYGADGVAYFRNRESKPPRQALRPHLPAGACVLFSSSADDQRSAEMTVSSDDGKPLPYGIMTRSFVDAVKEMCSMRQDNSGVESWNYWSLLSRTKQLVYERAQALLGDYYEIQEPQLSSSHEIDLQSTRFSM